MVQVWNIQNTTKVVFYHMLFGKINAIFESVFYFVDIFFSVQC